MNGSSCTIRTVCTVRLVQMLHPLDTWFHYIAHTRAARLRHRCKALQDASYSLLNLAVVVAESDIDFVSDPQRSAEDT